MTKLRLEPYKSSSLPENLSTDRKFPNDPKVETKINTKLTQHKKCKPRIVCMDMLNFAGSFFTIQRNKKKELPPWEMEIAKTTKKVKAFARAAKKSNIEIIGFIDKSVSTQEATKKWNSRRTQELMVGRRDVVTNMNLLLGTIMQEQGIHVHYSTIDCDDTIAAFAFKLGADVLSQDQDYFRYYTASCNTPMSVYSRFSVGQFLTLTPHPGPNPNSPRSKRELLTTLPDTRDSPYFLDLTTPHQITKCQAAWQGISHCYTRGCASNLTRLFPNPHLTVRPLRQALFHTIGVDKVREVMATWNFQLNEPEFREKTVEADPALVHLLDRPEEAVEQIFRGEQRPENCSLVGWKNHQFAQRAVVAELCAWATGTSVLEIIKLLTVNKNEEVKVKDKSVPWTKKDGRNRSSMEEQELPDSEMKQQYRIGGGLYVPPHRRVLGARNW